VNADRVLEDLRELARLTGGPDGARRVCWTDEWTKARDCLRSRLDELPVEIEVDAAGNLWALMAGEGEGFVIVGSHSDSVPAGGWLDGALGIYCAVEALRSQAEKGTPPVGLRLVDWADEEGARFGRSLFGSSCCAGTLDPDEVRGLTDRDGTALPDALAAHGVELDHMGESGSRLDGALAYLELHIEQGPVLEQLDLPLGAVLGTFGVRRHAVRFTGAHAHAGASPMHLRRDAFLAAARSSLAWRDDAAARDDVRATTGTVRVTPGIVTAFNGTCEVSLDQRALHADVLADMLATARAQSQRIAEEEGCTVAWERVWEIEPIRFDAELLELADAAIAEVAGTSTRLPSGPLHDAAEMARRIPTVMLFVKSLGGVSHTKEEDTPDADLERSVRALYELTRRTLAWAAAERSG
jgi:hydantoinase/carbamoylase family amidase